MKDTVKKLAAAALICGVALCGPLSMNRAGAWEFDKSDAADVVEVIGTIAGLLVDQGVVGKSFCCIVGASTSLISPPVLLTIGTGYGCYKLASWLSK